MVANSVFVVYMLILRLPYLLQNKCNLSTDQAGIFGNILDDIISKDKYFMLVFQIIIGVIQATIINSIANHYRMMRDANLFPGMVWILLICMFPDYLCNSTLLLANLFFLLSIRELFKVYKKTDIAENIFNIGFWLTTSSLFYPGFILFLFPVLIGLQILRSAKIKEFIMLLSGVVTPFIILFAIYYWNDELMFFKAKQLDVFAFNITFLPFKNGMYKAIFSMMIIGFSLFMYSKIVFKQSIQNIKYIEILYFVLLTGGLMTFFLEGRGIEQFLSIAIPLSFIGGVILFNISSQWAEVIHLLLIFAVYFWQFGPNL